MQGIVRNLLAAYESRIRDLDWMTAPTRQRALDKLHRFTAKIGYPDRWKSYAGLTIEPGDLFGNLRRAAQFEYDRSVARLARPVDRSEWDMTPQTIDAQYNPFLNEIVFPAAILQPPFFDMASDDAAIYGGIGAIIGHEIGHGFDDQGSRFDGDGAVREWWTDADRAAFERRSAALVAQYDGFTVLDGLKVNGAFTLGENIGDLGGVSIAYAAYRASLGGGDAPVLDGLSGDQRFFMGWAQAFLSKERPEALRAAANVDPHAPARFRVNGVVRNIPAFYDAFAVQPGDALYLAPERRVRIW
jgi:putative endopeptidase